MKDYAYALIGLGLLLVFYLIILAIAQALQYGWSSL